MQKLQSAQSSVELAKGWEQKGQPVWVLRCLTSALMNYLSIAVEATSEPAIARDWLEGQGVPVLLKSYCQSMGNALGQVDKKKVPASVVGGAYSHIVFAHMCSLLGMVEEEGFLAAVAVRPDVADISTPFWQGYAKTFHALVSHEGLADANEWRGQEFRGQEKYWQGYFLLMTAAITKGDVSAALRTVDELFPARNRDASISDDNYEIEGSGAHPVKLDFRKAALLASMHQT